jgi:hypothetical protein
VGSESSEIGIINYALTRIGAKMATDPNSARPHVVTLREMFADSRKELLSLYPWKFATETVGLTRALDKVPDVPWRYAFNKPTGINEIVRVVDVLRDSGYYSVPYRLSGRYLFSNESFPLIRYTHDVANPDEMTPSFRRLLGLHLAAEGCLKITQDEGRHKILSDEFKDRLETAKSNDSMGEVFDDLPEGTWVESHDYYA